ncbi:asparagine synthase (glutamine-hydrolyzing) [soil metagenome]
MCGIIGHITLSGTIDQNLFVSMRDTLKHRGPDDAGTYYNAEGTIALGHRRLSFFDLGPKGHQPMPYADGRYWITYNGEIYNFREVRKELALLGYTFQSETDTEVLLAAYQEWGKHMFHRLKGMYALGILDLETQKLLLARDRFGIKPLYYYQSNGHFIFASELKAIIRSDIVPKEIDVSSFADYFVYRYIPSPKTIWKDVKKLPPAHLLVIDLASLKGQPEEYWKPQLQNRREEEGEMIQQVDKMLLSSIDIHRRADVPVGSFLSGGYDSSALVYYLSRVSYKPKTFSIGFEEWQNSEHRFADIVAKEYGVENEAVIAKESDLDLLDIMPEVYDEPIADISIVPTYMVSRLARTKVKAVLSGEGADELFCGYTWQKDFGKTSSIKERLLNWLSPAPITAYYANAMAMGRFDNEELKRLLPPQQHRHIAKNVDWFYQQHAQGLPPKLKTLQWLDTKCFMAELVLTKVDRASMANSLEVRVPFLDHELFEYVLSTDEKVYFKPAVTKYLLHENLKGHLPEAILDRKKQGFVGPDSYYMNIDWYQQQLQDSTLVKAGLINEGYVTTLLENADHWRLWKLLVMEKWYRHWMG